LLHPSSCNFWVRYQKWTLAQSGNSPRMKLHWHAGSFLLPLAPSPFPIPQIGEWMRCSLSRGQISLGGGCDASLRTHFSHWRPSNPCCSVCSVGGTFSAKNFSKILTRQYKIFIFCTKSVYLICTIIFTYNSISRYYCKRFRLICFLSCYFWFFDLCLFVLPIFYVFSL
jgi:hypothetical protein